MTLRSANWSTKNREQFHYTSGLEAVMNRIPRWLALMGILGCIAMSGCIPNVAWLPDSSGFVFTETGPAEAGKDPKLRLVKYDIAQKQRDIIVDNLKNSLTTWPALSPNGAEIAVASVTWKGTQ